MWIHGQTVKLMECVVLWVSMHFVVRRSGGFTAVLLGLDARSKSPVARLPGEHVVPFGRRCAFGGSPSVAMTQIAVVYCIIQATGMYRYSGPPKAYMG